MHEIGFMTDIDFPNAILLAALTPTLLFMLSIAFFKRKKSKHKLYIKQSKVLISSLKTLDARQQFYRLRYKTNPYVFEESVLTGLEMAGHKIERSQRYSGDGGIDGFCYINNERYLIQSKKYSGYIKLQHLKEFHQICILKNSKGIFVHSGKTGQHSRYYAYTSGLVDIVSGERLLKLLSGKHECI